MRRADRMRHEDLSIDDAVALSTLRDRLTNHPLFRWQRGMVDIYQAVFVGYDGDVQLWATDWSPAVARVRSGVGDLRILDLDDDGNHGHLRAMLSHFESLQQRSDGEWELSARGGQQLATHRHLGGVLVLGLLRQWGENG